MIKRGLTIPEAIDELFKINVSRESPLLKDKANSLVRNKLIKVERQEKVQRGSVYLAEGQLVVLHNALLLNAVFTDPKQVKKIFEDTAYRKECAAVLKSVFSSQNSLFGISISSKKSFELIHSLECENSQNILYKEKLPNPFQQLPQVAMGSNTSLLCALLAQSSILAPADSLLLCFLKGEWQEASVFASQLSSDTPGLTMLQELINQKLKEAQEFDELLDFFRSSF